LFTEEALPRGARLKPYLRVTFPSVRDVDDGMRLNRRATFQSPAALRDGWG